MDLNRVALFVRVVETSSFTAAARSLGLRKSSVSRGVSNLEEELGVRLLNRTTRSLNLTDAGRIYFDRVREGLSFVTDATSDVKEMGQEPQGTVRLTAVPQFAEDFLAEPLARFVRRYPKIQLELVLTSRSVDLVEENIDIAVRAGRLQDSSLVARKIFSTDLQLTAAPSYLKRRGTPKALRDLAAHDCLLYRPEGGKSIWRLAGPDGPESVEVKGPIGADDLSFLHQATLAGAGIALLPALIQPKHLQRGELVRVLPQYAMKGGAVHLVSPHARHQLARVRLLRDYLSVQLKKIFDGMSQFPVRGRR
jgi:DNA-binding transcriptional LysR family regulator